MNWPASRASRVLQALLQRISWVIKRQSGSHRTLQREGWPDYVFAFHDSEEIGPRMLVRIGKKTGLTADDLLIGTPKSAGAAGDHRVTIIVGPTLLRAVVAAERQPLRGRSSRLELSL